MQYRKLGKTEKFLSALGFGTNRFAPSDLKTDEGLSKCAEIIINGVRKGINYIDCGYTYSMGKAEEIVKRAMVTLKQENLNYYTSTKVMQANIKDESDIRKNIDKSLLAMDLSSVTFGFVWQVKSKEELKQILKSGGLYEGLKKAKDEKIIEHIVISSHMSPDDTADIIKTGIFDACMISCNILNVHTFKTVFVAAKNSNTGIFTMNSLGGGVIVGENTLNMRNFLGLSETQSLAGACLRHLYSYQQITTCLSTMQNLKELEENLIAFADDKISEAPINIAKKVTDYKGYCTKCRYCESCPEKLPVSDLMYAYSNWQFADFMQGYGASVNNKESSNKEFNKAKQLFNSRFFDYKGIPESHDNPCVKCGRCEERCTQSLPIIQRIDEIYGLSEKYHFNYTARKERFNKLLNTGKYKKVCFFPAGQYTSYLINDYLRFFGSFPFKIIISDNSCSSGYVNESGYDIIPVSELNAETPDIILITSYTYGNDIYNQLISDNKLIGAGIYIIKLHQDDDVQWY